MILNVEDVREAKIDVVGDSRCFVERIEVKDQYL